MKLKLLTRFLLVGAVVAVVTLLVSACSPAQGRSRDSAQDQPIDRHIDFSDFDKYEYQWVNGLECGPYPGVHEATIQRQPDGDLTFDFVGFEETDSEVKECPSGMRADTTTGFACLELVQLPQRTLTDDEAASVHENFSDVKITIFPENYEGPVCEVACDWDFYSWGTLSFTAGTCGCRDGCLDYEKAEEINELITQLATATLPSGGAEERRNCLTYDVVNTYVWDIEIASDGRVLIATNNGLGEYDPATNKWVLFTTEDGLLSNMVRTLDIAPNNDVWLLYWNVTGATVFEGAEISHITTSDGLPSISIYEIAIDLDDTIWFATDKGLAHRDLQTGKWLATESLDEAVEFPVSKIIRAPDGSLWLANS